MRSYNHPTVRLSPVRNRPTTKKLHLIFNPQKITSTFKLPDTFLERTHLECQPLASRLPIRRFLPGKSQPDPRVEFTYISNHSGELCPSNLLPTPGSYSHPHFHPPRGVMATNTTTHPGKLRPPTLPPTSGSYGHPDNPPNRGSGTTNARRRTILYFFNFLARRQEMANAGRVKRDGG